ncbi:hypothetical protein CJ255_13835 [Candidatus Viridilinea mediisalina]|uniref:Manganese transporter n=2 Tax=Candidatus Viridilinea mediisalina TaxID=2024553 RepID=A0A2A6RH82_9CHLR|nr:hypothetical protein CJ255_13835 [Candidatus Viridilinea mediisalina]
MTFKRIETPCPAFSCRLSAIALLFLLMVLLAACGQTATVADEPRNATAEASPLNVVVTTQHLGDTVANLAQDRVELTVLFGPGIDPHTYIPTEGDLQILQNADLIFYNGLLLEAQMGRVFTQMEQRQATQVVAVAEALPAERLLLWEEEEGYDPHIWKDVQLWIAATEVIRTTLMERDPANAATYEANANAFVAELEQLHQDILTQIERIPPELRVLVTAHDAFSYYGRAYGLEVEAVQGISTEAEASAADIQAVAAILIERQIPAIFVETTVSPRTIEAVMAAANAGGQAVRIGGELFADDLGEPGTPEGTYIGMMRHNTDTIVAALAGE